MCKWGPGSLITPPISCSLHMIGWSLVPLVPRVVLVGFWLVGNMRLKDDEGPSIALRNHFIVYPGGKEKR